MELKTNVEQKETYIAPDIEVVEIETEQNILAGSDGKTESLPGMDPSYW